MMTGIQWQRGKPRFKIEYRAIPERQFMARGRPKKQNVIRDASGKSRGEIVDFSVVMNQPHRRGALDPMSHLLGFPLGRLRLSDDISDDQLRTGSAWAGVVSAYAAIMGVPAPSPRSGELSERVQTGFYNWGTDEIPRDQETPEERAERIHETKTKYADCFEAMGQLGRTLGRGHRILFAVNKVCIENQYPNQGDIGDLRLGLNAIDRILRRGR